MATHIAFLQLMNVNPADGTVYQRGGNSLDLAKVATAAQQNLPIKGALSFSTEQRVISDPDLPNTADNPDLKTYVELESDAGFDVIQINQTMVITAS